MEDLWLDFDPLDAKSPRKGYRTNTGSWCRVKTGSTRALGTVNLIYELFNFHIAHLPSSLIFKHLLEVRETIQPFLDGVDVPGGKAMLPSAATRPTILSGCNNARTKGLNSCCLGTQQYENIDLTRAADGSQIATKLWYRKERPTSCRFRGCCAHPLAPGLESKAVMTRDVSSHV